MWVSPACALSRSPLSGSASALESTYNPGSPRLHADGRRLKQVLVNLLTNAVKFTPEGGLIQLEVIERPDRSRLDFRVRDSGIGIAAEHLPKLFRSFQQIDSALNRKYAGTGLGLALVKRMTEMHGGEVLSLHRVLVVGARCSPCQFLSIPVRSVKRSWCGLHPKPRSPDHVPRRAPHPALAEDHPTNRLLLERHLHKSVAAGSSLRPRWATGYRHGGRGKTRPDS